MKLLLLFGDAAVGKMTVGQELCKITDFRLFHNHISIEPVLEVFGEFNGTVIRKFRETVFEEFAKTDKYGLIFTFMWAFDCKEDWEYTAKIVDIFKGYNAEVYYVELFAPQEVRLKRNATENRLKNKPSKRDIEFSNRLLIYDDNNHRMVSNDGEIPFENYIKIDNTDLSAEETARIIKDRFGF
ncbi:shikimate kinase [Clostridium sp. CAG:413]|nr:shikimate kinase [Clostridium sp. CAG:413]